MNISFEFNEGELCIALSGRADSLLCEPGTTGAAEDALRILDEQVLVRRPSRLTLEFTGLEYIDSTSFRKISMEVEKLRAQLPVLLVGPGSALERLFSLIDAPSGWKWTPPKEPPVQSRKDAQAPQREEAGDGDSDEAETEDLGGSGLVGEGSLDTFEIDLDRERLLLENEPPHPEYDPMAEPLDLLGTGDARVSPGRRVEELLEEALAGDGIPQDLVPPELPASPALSAGTADRAETDSVSKDRPAAGLRRPSGAEEGEAACRGRRGGGSASPTIKAVRQAPQAPSTQGLGQRESREKKADGFLGDGDIRFEDDLSGIGDGIRLQGESFAPGGLEDPLEETFPSSYGSFGLEADPAPRSAGRWGNGERGQPAGLGPSGASGSGPGPGPSPLAPGISGGLPSGGFQPEREAVLKDRLVASFLAEDGLRRRIAELEAEKLWLLRELEVARGRANAPAPPQTVQEPEPGSPMARANGSAVGAAADPIPGFLRGDIPRGRIVRAFAAILERRRMRRSVSPEELRRLSDGIVWCVHRAPFASFDLAEARDGASPAAQTVYTTAMALCMASRAGTRPERQKSLALAGLLTALLGQPLQRLGEIPQGEGALRVLARKVHRRLLDLGCGGLGAGQLQLLQEAEVREDLRLLSLAREFWRRIGAGPEGGSDPASAARALARGEVARGAPERLRRLFIETFSLYPPGTWVRLGSGEVGVVVAPGAREAACPLVMSLFTGGERELRSRPPRLVDTGTGEGMAVRAVVRCPVAKCAAPRTVLRSGAGVPA